MGLGKECEEGPNNAVLLLLVKPPRGVASNNVCIYKSILVPVFAKNTRSMSCAATESGIHKRTDNRALFV